MTRNSTFLFILAALIFIGAFALRIRLAEDRPFHTDEAVNAFILEETLSWKGYRYRSDDHHGPTLFEISARPLRAAGITRVADMEAWMLRLLPAFAGALTAAAAFLFRKETGFVGACASAILLAIMAPFVYYGGYFIHETLLIALTAGLFAVLWRWRDSGATSLALVGGVIAGVMLATKETAAPIMLVMFAVVVPGGAASLRKKASGAVLATTTAALVTVAIYSSVGGLADFFTAVRLQTERGLGEAHAHPFSTYIAWMMAPTSVGVPWSGWLLAGLGTIALVMSGRKSFVRCTALWAASLFLLQSFLPYKTPWLMLSFLLPLTLLAGCGAEALWQNRRTRVVAFFAGLIGVALLAKETAVRCGTEAVNPDNPLAYSPSSPDLVRLERDLAGMAGPMKNRGNFFIEVVAEDYWPLPWVLRKFPLTGFYPVSGAFPRPMRGAFIGDAGSLANHAELAPFESYEIRPGVRVFVAPTPAKKEGAR